MTAKIEAALRREIDALQRRVAITRLVAQDMSRYVSDDTAKVSLVIDDVLAAWADAAPGTEGAVVWREYANRVEWARPDTGDTYRAEFCSQPSDEPFDEEAYFEAVWADQCEILRLNALLCAPPDEDGRATAA